MINRKLSLRSILLLSLAVILALGCLWYWSFHLPMQAELARIADQSRLADDQLAEAAAKLARMDAMEAELDAAGFKPGAGPEVAPFDNKQAVLTELNRILRKSMEYTLHFADPDTQADGTVRRTVVMDFRCADFSDAQTILRELAESPWLCLIRNLSVSSTGSLLSDPVDVQATVTFLESTRLMPFS